MTPSDPPANPAPDNADQPILPGDTDQPTLPGDTDQPTPPGAADPMLAAEAEDPSADDDVTVRELAHIPAVEVITRAAVMLMSAAAEKLGLAEDGDRYLDRDEARRLITALAGLYSAAADDLGAHRQPIRAGIKALQDAFHEGASSPDPRGQGPGEVQLGATRGRLTAD